MSIRFPTSTRAAMAVLHWLGRAVRALLIVAVWGVGIFIGLYLLTVLNWAPLWFRLYEACMTQQREANTLTEVLRHRADCIRIATGVIEKGR